MTNKIFYAMLPIILLGLLAQVIPLPAQGTSVKQVTDPALNEGKDLNSSHNWAGYFSTGGTFTSVKGSWFVPKINITDNSADATWIGIGGMTSSDLLQIGTEAMVNNGKVSYQAWYEMLPASSYKIPITISPGDYISASILQQSTNQWTISLNDITTGKNFQTNVNYKSSLSSAEWIEEMPVQGRFYVPLDNFGSVQFNDLSTIRDGVELSPSRANAVSMVMINYLDQVLAQPSQLGSDGSSFTITRTASESSQNISPFRSWRRINLHVRQQYYRHNRGRHNGGFLQRYED
jgi:hypothetical protein